MTSHQHLQDEQLLSLLDGEVPELDVASIRAHIETCWTCRTRLEEIESIIGEYVRYREVVTPFQPPPPARWANLEPRFQEVDRSVGARRSLRPPHWLAIAAALLIVFFLVRRFETVTPVSAAELLRKATAAQQPQSPRRRIQIKTRHRTFTRPAALATNGDSQDAELRAMFERAHFDWDDPLSTRSFAAWRDQLPEKRDRVRTLGDDAYMIQTSTSTGELREAQLTLRKRDLQPTREMLEFTNETVEIEAVPDEQIAAAAPPPERGTPREPSRSTETVSPAHRDLQVFSALHKIGADLGEPVEMSENGSRLLVTGTGLTSEQKRQLEASLLRIPGVEVRFDDATPRAGNSPGQRVTPLTAPLQPRLQALLGSRESVEEFTNRALDASDAMLARAHALRALAKAFPGPAEASLDANDRDILRVMRSDHTTALAARVRELQTILDPVIPASALRGEKVESATWQAAAQALFASAQNLDQLLNKALAGSNADADDSDFQHIAAALARVQGQLR